MGTMDALRRFMFLVSNCTRIVLGKRGFHPAYGSNPGDNRVTFHGGNERDSPGIS